MILPRQKKMTDMKHDEMCHCKDQYGAGVATRVIAKEFGVLPEGLSAHAKTREWTIRRHLPKISFKTDINLPANVELPTHQAVLYNNIFSI